MKRVLFLLTALAVSGCPQEATTDVCKGRVEGDLVVTEVMIDPDGPDTGNEWIEIFNTLGTPVDLKGMTVLVSDATGAGQKTHAIRAGTVPARGYFVLGDVRSGPNPAWINYTYNTSLNSLPNASGTVGIKCGQVSLAKFTWTTPGKATRSRSLDGALEPSSTATELNYCDTPVTMAYSGLNAGTPGAANARCEVTPVSGACIDEVTGQARPVVAPLAGDLIITEVMARPKTVSAANGEWVELFADAEVDLNGLKLATANSSTTLTSATCLHAGAGTYVLLARNGDAAANGNLPTPKFAYGSLSIPDTTQQTLTLSSVDATIDRVVLYPSASGHSWQLNPTTLDAVSNDSPDSFCSAPTQWTVGSGDFGSPGAENPACPVVADPNLCFDDTLMASRGIRRPATGELVFTEWMSAPSTPQGDREYLEAVAKADFDLNGVTLVVGTGRTSVNSPTCLPVLANSYVLFGHTDDPLLNGGLPPLVASFSTTLTGTSVFSLLGSDGGVHDTVSATGEFTGASTQVAPGFENAVDNDAMANRCRAPNRWNPDGGGDFGSPGAPNPACPLADACIDPSTQLARPVRRPNDGELVITEWMARPSAISSTNGEYFEVLAKADLDLNGLTLQVGTTKTVLNSANCLGATANSFLVFGRNAVPAQNGNLPALAGVFTGGLTDTGSSISVFGQDGGLFDSITYGSVGTAGISSQVKPGAETPTDNDVATNVCPTPLTSRYGPVDPNDGGLTGDRGTPGLANVPCP